jgi:2'-5' RNA ligase
MRLFLATFLNPANQAFYRRLNRDLVKRHANVLRAIPDDSAHITYAFISELPETLVGNLATAISEATRAWQAFDIELGSPRVMHSAGRPRLVCADLIRGATEVARLTSAVCATASTIFPGLRPSRTPHVTLARFRKHATRSDARSVSSSLSHEQNRIDRVTTVQFVVSVLTPAGPVYTVRAEAPLAIGSPTDFTRF